MNHKSLRVALKLLHGAHVLFALISNKWQFTDVMSSHVGTTHKFCARNPPNATDNCYSRFGWRSKVGEKTVEFKLFKRFVSFLILVSFCVCRKKKRIYNLVLQIESNLSHVSTSKFTQLPESIVVASVSSKWIKNAQEM